MILAIGIQPKDRANKPVFGPVLLVADEEHLAYIADGRYALYEGSKTMEGDLPKSFKFDRLIDKADPPPPEVPPAQITTVET